ncbi:hypothetical protein BASA60_006057 [Batrachochytrium salamandrivorans]|nr:hypothetical protein BASA60_006057 [Batrachochytrium salamandrivorans]
MLARHHYSPVLADIPDDLHTSQSQRIFRPCFAKDLLSASDPIGSFFRLHGIVVAQSSPSLFLLDDSTATVICVLTNELLHLQRVKSYLAVGACVQVLGTYLGDHRFHCSGIQFLTDPALEIMCDLQITKYIQQELQVNPTDLSGITHELDASSQKTSFFCRDLDTEQLFHTKDEYPQPIDASSASHEFPTKPFMVVNATAVEDKENSPFQLAMFSNALTAIAAYAPSTDCIDRVPQPKRLEKIPPHVQIAEAKTSILSILADSTNGCTLQDFSTLLVDQFDSKVVGMALEQMQQDWVVYHIGERFLAM